jgi:predicted ATPase
VRALGRSFSHELISAVAQIPQKELDQALDQLVAAELIFRRGIPPEAEYAFKHILVQEATYSTLLRSRPQQIHARILASLEEKFPDIVIAQPALLAHHCTEAGLIEKAVGYWLKAGQQSVARSAMTEAVAQLQRGLELLGGLPEGGGRQGQELELSIALGPALIASKGYSASHVREIIARARALAEQLNQTNYLVPLLYGQWMFHTARAEHDAALSVAEQVDRIGVTRSDAALVSLAHSSRGWTLCNLGDFVGARASFECCQDLGKPTHRSAYASLTEDVSAVTLGYLGMTLAYLGLIDEARARARQALLEAR